MDQGQEESFLTTKDVGYFRVTDRPFKNYKQIFSITEKTFKPNARILEIGSGKKQEFARHLAQTRPDIQTISVDPTLGLPVEEDNLKEMRISYDISDDKTKKIRPSTEEERTNRKEEAFKNTVAGLAPDLPFRDKAFDYIFDNHAAFMYLPDENNNHAKYVEELLRVLKPEGTAYIYPLSLYSTALDDPQAQLEKSKEHIKSIVEKKGILNYNVFLINQKRENGEEINKLGINFTKT